MELSALLERMKMEHLLAQLDDVCEHAAKGDLDYKGFLTQSLEAEWRGRHQRGVESRRSPASLAKYWLNVYGRLRRADSPCQRAGSRSSLTRRCRRGSGPHPRQRITGIRPASVGSAAGDTRAGRVRTWRRRDDAASD